MSEAVTMGLGGNGGTAIIKNLGDTGGDSQISVNISDISGEIVGYGITAVGSTSGALASCVSTLTDQTCTIRDSMYANKITHSISGNTITFTLLAYNFSTKTWFGTAFPNAYYSVLLFAI